MAALPPADCSWLPLDQSEQQNIVLQEVFSGRRTAAQELRKKGKPEVRHSGPGRGLARDETRLLANAAVSVANDAEFPLSVCEQRSILPVAVESDAPFAPR
ncbi:hypothetical protein [Agrobacterium tumefaciens]|uniref:Transposase n=1 Tax=Agrobacterium tumefaciens TaxID=358 RepID=A0A4D7Z2L0_AGRTU|nr:hypothetical protein [Agrobacterium tumefaciens]QCL97279.1 hypothetical protein CFBP7129_24465 [Agrobacterium tumefaciens]